MELRPQALYPSLNAQEPWESDSSFSLNLNGGDVCENWELASSGEGGGEDTSKLHSGL